METNNTPVRFRSEIDPATAHKKVAMPESSQDSFQANLKIKLERLTQNQRKSLLFLFLCFFSALLIIQVTHGIKKKNLGRLPTGNASSLSGDSLSRPNTLKP